MRLCLLTVVAVLQAAALCAAGADGAPDPAGVQFFEAKVRPVLVEHCAACHSAGAKKIKANLLLDSAAGLLKGGDSGPAIVPGHPEQSRLIDAIHYQNVDLQMPPKKKLADQQIADLTAWVKMGAPWPAAPGAAPAVAAAGGFDLQQRKASHWCWRPVQPVQPPAVKDAAWPKSNIDAFVLARLKLLTSGRWLWSRTISSTVVGQGLDSVVFITLAFAGSLGAASLQEAILNQWIAKTAYETLATPLTYAAVTFLKRVDDLDVYDRHTNFNPLALP